MINLEIFKYQDKEVRTVKIDTDYSKYNLTKTQFERLRAKLKNADIIREVKGELRVNPYFYLRNDATVADCT